MIKSYHNADMGLSLDMPFTWQATHNEQIPLILIAPIDKGFRANMSIILTPLETPTLEALAIVRDAAREDRSANYADFALMAEDTYSHNGLTGTIEHFHWTTNDTRKPVTQLFALLLNTRAEMVSVHGTCLTKLEDKYLSRFREVIASLQFDAPDGDGDGDGDAPAGAQYREP